ncbi:lipocalin-like domain-containing protein [Nostoc sp.]|uniref:lipocalin-like domain-containing protein n=1 Tax=Nostoc sp. TaxID=1180 RepID=UPI002FFB93AD
MTNPNFVGVWKLVSWKTENPNGKIIYPYGKNPIGHLTYTQDGYISANIMKDNCLPLELSVEELIKTRKVFLNPWLLFRNGRKYIKAIIRYFKSSINYISYSGKYQIQGDKVIHHVEVSLIPDWIGKDLERTFEITDHELLLTTLPLDGSPQYLQWKRI